MTPEQLRVLTRPFDDVKTRPGRSGQPLQYIEGHQVVARLNEALGGSWSFKVLEHQVTETEVVVLGELQAGELIKQAFGGAEVTRTRDGKLVSLADDLKSAATDALKKAATLLGVGLQRCAVEERQTEPPRRPRLVVPEAREPDMAPPVEGRLSKRQAEFIAKLGADQGRTAADLDELARQRYGRPCAELTVQQASDFIKELLRAA
ncbi:MAG: hypothetical protein HY902_21035 [Deltaproteobacteria bacterium]|nr:hypothetical protein [Deltaproteobacteria bacterium]